MSLVNRVLFPLLLAACAREPTWPKAAHFEVAAEITSATLEPGSKHKLAWVFAERSVSRVAHGASAPTPAQLRAFYTCPILGLFRGGPDFAIVIHDPVTRAHAEQSIVRDAERDRLDGIAVDLSPIALDDHAVAFVEELAAIVHARDQKVGVIVGMTCRDVSCNGIEKIGIVTRAADLVVVDELDEDIASGARRSNALREALQHAPTARVFLRANDLASSISDARELGLGGVFTMRADDSSIFELAH